MIYSDSLQNRDGRRSLHNIHQFEQWRHHLNATSQWLFRCYRHLGVFSLPAVCCLHWSLPLGRLGSVQLEIGIVWHGWDGTLIKWKRVVQIYFLLCGITEYFYHTEPVHRWNRERHLIIHVFYCQLEFEFSVQSHDIAFQIADTGTSIDQIGLSLECRYPPPIDSSRSWDR